MSIYECPPLEDNLKMDELEIPGGISQVILYHGTSSNFRDGILLMGLKPRNQTENSVYEGNLISNGELVYLARREVAEGAADLALEKFGGERMVVQVQVQVDVNNLTEDEDVKKIWGSTGWKESLRLNGTCAYKGQVNPIKQLVIYNGESYTDIKEIVSPP